MRRGRIVRGVFGGARPDDIYPRARALALRAVELDPMLADGHVALARQNFGVVLSARPRSGPLVAAHSW